MSRPARRKPAASSLKLDGDLTIYTAANAQQQLLGALNSGRALEIDLGDVAELDSAGLQQLLALVRECEALARPLRIVAASDCVREVVALFGLDARFALPASSV